MATIKAGQTIRIKVLGYDVVQIEEACGKIVRIVTGTGATVRGPIPLPTKKEIITILRAVHKYKDSREQFERRVHKRLIDIYSPSQKTIEVLTRLDLPAGVDFEVKLGA